ncbi:uncharacterized protein LOC117792737 [Drosophila innubila]|uniref:uncharacterized protein LOC117792737 n=1 Tax=Drosophila innubila TaxID=198719 RepID=UPI00148BC325|nr:uncharacterized protein LOC117792737 [Drosophila innubila]
MKRCYCGHRGVGSGGGGGSSILKSNSHISRLQQPQRTDLLSLTSSSRQSVQPTQFVKRPTARNNSNPAMNLGLGHSNSGLCRDFSRRNSATTTVSHCSSCCSSSGYAPQLQQQQRESRVKVLSWANGEPGASHSNNNSNASNHSHCEHTDNRRVYEQRACATSRLTAEGQVQGQIQTTPSPLPPTASPARHCNNDDELQRLLALQQFRLLNASDCFSSQRQDELRLQRAYDKLGMADTAKWQKNKANETRQHTLPAPTPYALRQKLLQLRLQQEQAAGRGTGAACAPLERSCALRFNCH